MLTIASVRAARARARPYKIFDERGLHLHVTPAGRMTWRVKYRLGGREQLLTIGCYPDVGLTDARLSCDAAHESLARGEKPRRSAPGAVPATFEVAARAWFEHERKGWTPVHAGDVITSLERDVFPAIGAMPLRTIRSPDVLQVLRAVERRGAGETARRLRQRISAVFALAISEGFADADPAAIVSRALARAVPPRQQPALTDIGDCRALLEQADRAGGGAAAKLASRFLALTAVRLDAVRGACWSEVEELDGPAPLWRVPAVRMKLRAGKKQLAAHDHLVPLSAEAVAVLRAAQEYSRNIPGCSSELIFVGRGGGAIAEGAIGALYKRTRFAGRHVPHGWRASFSTILNEAVPGERDAIDLALGHAPKREDGKIDKVEGAYNRARHLSRRRALFDRWGALLA